MVVHNKDGRWIKYIFSGTSLIVITFVATMWANTRELTKDVPECKIQISQNTKDIQTATQKNEEQDKDLEELKQLQKETLTSFNQAQKENAEKMGEIFAYIKQRSK